MKGTSLAAQLFITLLTLFGPRAAAQELTPFFEGRVVRVVSGDTIVVHNRVTGQEARVRLRGTDAPELAQPHGEASRRRLESLLAGKTVRVEFRFTDRFAQVLGRVLLDGEELNEAQLRDGLAWFRTALANEVTTEDREYYAQVEKEARAARRGLWADPSPVAPWEFRRANNISEDPRDDPPTTAAAAAVNADRRTKTYFTPDCAGFARVPARSRVRFKSAAAAERAGYKLAGGCAK